MVILSAPAVESTFLFHLAYQCGLPWASLDHAVVDNWPVGEDTTVNDVKYRMLLVNW